MNKLLFSFFLLFSSIIFSQKTGKQDDGLITGKIIDATTSKPLDYVSFRLFKANESKVISGIYTDKSGKINLENVSFGTFYAVCSFSGYENDTIKDIILSLNSKVYNLGTIKLNPSATNLKEFEVVGNMDVLKAGIDKKIYNVGEDLSVKGGTANDILTRLPSVELDQEGKISLRGEGTVTVLIDGRPSSISGGNGKTLLDALPAGSIERIEIVTNPSAKYDPDGNSGIINIVLKKNKLKGFNGLVSTNLASGNIRNGNVAESNLSLSYRNGAVNIYGIYSYRYLEGYRNNDSYINQTNADGSRFILNQYRTGTDLNAGHTFRTGADFNLKDRQTLGISATGSIGVRDRTGDLWNSVYDTLNNRTNLWERTSYDPSQQQNLDFNANYRYDFKKDRGNLVIDATQSLGKEGIQGYYQENYFEPDSVPSVGINSLKQQLFNKEKNNITTLQADLTYLFPKISARMETGLKTILRDQQVDTESESFDYMSNQFIQDTLANFLYQYKERIFSAYGVFGQQLGKFKYQGGIRLEQAYQLPNLVSEGININNPPYFNIFPSAHIRYEIVPKSEFSLSYSKRITRPASADMNPFTNYSDPFNLRRGNPYLKPEYTDSYDFGFIHDRKKYSVTSSVYYRNSKGVISRVKEYYENNTSAVTFMNIAETHSLGSDVVVNVKPNSWWKASLSWNGNYIWYVTNQESLPNRQGYFHNFKFNSSIEFWKKTASLQVSVTYNGKRVTVQGIAQRQGPTDIAFEKRLANGKWTLGARVSDVFNVQGFYFKVDRPTVEQTSNFKWMTRRFYFSASYKFGKLEMNNKKLPGGEGGGDM
jgi:outer membrane receptor protein involved in Fe transport